MPKHLYFVLAEGVGLVKIGIANDVESRFRDLDAMSPVPLTCLGYIRHGGRNLEGKLHRTFREKRVRGEWFQYDDEMRSFIHVSLRPSLMPSPIRRRLSAKERADRKLVAYVRQMSEAEVASTYAVEEVAAEAGRIRERIGE